MVRGYSRTLSFLLFSILILAAGAAKAGDVPYYINASLLGGQYFFSGDSASLSGNASVLVSASKKTKSGITLIPLYNGRYQGTKQVADLVGGGTLFQELMEHRASLKGIYEIAPEFRVKPELGYKLYYLKETKNEKWGTGLFDYRRPEAAVELEAVYREPYTARFVFDMYWIDFPNYTSLESQIGQSSGTMARELAGADVVNSQNKSFAFYINGDLGEKFIWDGGVNYTIRDFKHQHIINSAGLFDSPTRIDNVWMVDASLKYPFAARGMRMMGGINAGLVKNGSNQNTYDATNTKFVEGYYDYYKYRLGLDLVIQKPIPAHNPMQVHLAAGWAKTKYGSRPVQDATGVYGTDKIYMNEYTVNGTLTYPIADRFSWLAVLQYGKQTSNMSYEKLYRYEFDIVTYMLGVGYEFE